MMIVLLVRAMRPRQWVKNAFVLAPLVFGRRLTDPAAVADGLLAMAAFCLLAGALYIVNDWIDAPRDRLHPQKRRRPIASGALPVPTALAGAAAAALLALGISFRLGAEFLLVAGAYAGLTLLYSMFLKTVVIVDVMAIAAGFVLRVLGGAVAIGVEASHWLLICAFVLALFLGFAKRRQELLQANDGAPAQRQVLGEYSVGLLEQIKLVLMGTAVVCYMFYAVAPETVARFGTDKLLYGTVFVFYGLMRYLLLLGRPGAGENPGDVVFRDRPLTVAVAGWVLYNTAVIYGGAMRELLRNWWESLR
jgi:4-hydroxybenzoate polyprenyltransferase